jgi:hypothetical protein
MTLKTHSPLRADSRVPVNTKRRLDSQDMARPYTSIVPVSTGVYFLTDPTGVAGGI